MEDQYDYLSFPQVPGIKYLPQDDIITLPPPEMAGGLNMDRALSNASSDSYVSHFSGESYFSTPESPNTIMDWSYSPIDNQKHTPSSLGWKTVDLLKWLDFYTFIVPKGKDPYFELQNQWSPTGETPARIYLDQPRHRKKNEYPCCFPVACNGKTQVFKRPADLERHYKNVHLAPDQKDSFLCDYLRCSRANDPFTRKDHFRDHLKDYHKEDIGTAKGGKKLERRERPKVQQKWLDERVIFPAWWRCARCLIRNYVADVEWECRECKGTCEEERIRLRETMVPAMGDGDTPRNMDTYSFPNCNMCSGTGIVWGQFGAYVNCACNPQQEPPQAYSSGNGLKGDPYWPPSYNQEGLN